MATSVTEILNAAINLPESERLLLVTRLMDTLPDAHPGVEEDDPALIDELERRAVDTAPTVPVSELWKRD